MAAAGAPEGFEDVVGSIIPIPEDQPNTPAHWGVTFATADADATAKEAAELGAKVIVPPFRPLVHVHVHHPDHRPRRPPGRDVQRE
jgi:predicted enzyme related to lactoylglutathione lyase